LVPLKDPAWEMLAMKSTNPTMAANPALMRPAKSK
jgi:hypothetical protein